MNALVSHPDIIRWFLWSWEYDSNWNRTIYNLFNTMLHGKIDITITNSTLTIFEGVVMDIRTCPDIVKTIYKDLSSNKETYFKSIHDNSVFRNFKYQQCIFNHHLEKNIDRLGWITWSIWWLIKFQPGRFFIMKDILSVPLKRLEDSTHVYKNTIPMPPWIKKTPNNIRSIYTTLQRTIYYECLT